MYRKKWQKPQPLSFSFPNGESANCHMENGHISTTPTVSLNFHPQNLVTVSDTLILAPFSKRGVIDFGDSLTVGLPNTRYLRLKNPRKSSIKVQCKRYPTSDELALHWLLTSQDVAENLSDPENQALIDPESPVTSLVSTPSLELAPYAECLLRIVWTPKPTPLVSLLDVEVTGKDTVISNLRHTLQFSLGGSGSLIVEANIIASTIKQPHKGKKKKKTVSTVSSQGGVDTATIFTAMAPIPPNDGIFSNNTHFVPPPPLLIPNVDLSETLIQYRQPTSDSTKFSSAPQPTLDSPVHLPQSPAALQSAATENFTPTPRRARASWVLDDENRRRQPRASSSGLRILAAYVANKEKRLSQSLDQLNLEASLLEETEFQTPKRSVSTVNDLNRSPENEPATAFISPALLSPVVKQDSNVLFTTNKSTSTTAPENIFGWDASAALSEANELGFTRWLNHLFTCGHATRSSISKSPHQEDDPRRAILNLLHTPSFSAPGHRIEREIDSGKLVVNKDLNFKADKGLQLRTVELFTSHYSPVWLNPCVEVLSKFVHIPENQLGLPPKASAMTKRVYRYLFADVSSLKTKNAKAGEKQMFKTWQNQEHYNRQIVKRCLTLIWLLDQAKVKKIHRFDPCLFNLSAPAKSSAALCLTLGRNYLPRESNLPRSLSHLGANLSVSQTPLDEFDFTVTNLAVDLRDGLRLVKLADLLLVDSPNIFPSHNSSLISLVRFPAISRLQKIHNVRLALSAFEKVVGQNQLYTAAGKPISERDIVDGHRSKTLSLLWFILLRFQVTALLNPLALRNEISCLIGSIQITSTNRALVMSLRREADGLLANSSSLFGMEVQDPLVEMENNQRALFLWVRAVMSAGGYSDVNVENLDQSFADGRVFCYLLHYYLPTLLPKRFIRIVTTQTAKSFPGIPLHLLLRNNSANLQLFQQRLSQLADVPSLINIGTKQTTASVSGANNTALLSPGIVLTTLAFLASRIICAEGGVGHLRRVVRSHAARIIQSWWRRLRATNDSGFRHARSSVRLFFKTPQLSIENFPTATEIQTMESIPHTDDLLNTSTIIVGDNFIQSTISTDFLAEEENRHSVEGNTQRLDISAIFPAASGDDFIESTILTEWKNCDSKESEVQSTVQFTQQIDNISNISDVTPRDNFIESAVSEKKAKSQSTSHTNVTSLVSELITSSEKDDCSNQSESTIQPNDASNRFFTFTEFAVPAEFSFHERVDSIRESIESVFNENKEIDNLEMAAISVLASFANRSVIDYSPESIINDQDDDDENERRHNAATRIQRSVRAWLLERRRKAFVSEVQSQVKSFLAKKVIEKRQTANAQRRRLAALVIQNAWRAYLIRKHFLQIREKVIFLQVLWRRVLARRALAQRTVEERSAVIIQRWWRSIKQRRVFLLQRQSTILIQFWWRNVLAERRRQKLAVELQAAVRAYFVRHNLEQKRRAAIVIQRHVRSFLSRKREVTAACKIQHWWRVRSLRRRIAVVVAERRELVRRNQAACILQHYVRIWLAHRRELAAACTIQRWWRKVSQIRAFLQSLKAARCIQRWWRVRLLRRHVADAISKRRELLRLEHEQDERRRTQAAIVIQRSIRIWLAYRRNDVAAIKIQTWWRAVTQRQKFLRSVEATRCIQRWWRARLFQRHILKAVHRRRELRSQKQEEEELMRQQNAAAVIIQTAWRRFSARKQLEERAGIQGCRANNAAGTIQRAWRTCKQRKNLREQSMFQTCIENDAACIIQRAWKTYCQRRQAEKEEQAAILIQRNWRASRLQLWLYNRRRAALIIQAAWRGHKARSSVAKKTGVHVAAVRKRLSEASKQAKEQPHNCLGVRAQRALAHLLRYTSVASVLDALGHLETATRLSREVCTWLLTVPSSSTPSGHIEYLPHVLLRLLHLCNRSVADEEVALAAVSVMLNLVNNVDHRALFDPTAVHNIWWQRHESSLVEIGSTTNYGNSVESKSIVEYLFVCLQRLSRARIGTGSVRLFARTAALLSKLCMALQPDFEIPAHFVRQIEILLPSVRRLWSATLARNPVRPEVTALIRNYEADNNRHEFLLRRVNLELILEHLPSKPQIDPLVACELLMLTLHEHQYRQRQCGCQHQSVQPGSPF